MKIIVVSFPKVKRPHADAQYYGTLTDVVKNSSNRFSFLLLPLSVNQSIEIIHL